MTKLSFQMKVPKKLIEGILSGEYEVINSLVKQTSGKKKIVGQLQKTGGFDQLFNALNSATSPINSVSSVATVIQNEQIKSKLTSIEALLGNVQNLELANLATSFVGIGVTVASTAIVLQRLNQLDASIKGLEEKIDDQTAKLQETRIREIFVDIKTQLQRLDTIDMGNVDKAEIKQISTLLHNSFNQVVDKTEQVVVQMAINPKLLMALLETLSICADAQVQSLLYLDQKQEALHYAKLHNAEIEKLIWEIPQDVLLDKLAADVDQAKQITDVSRNLHLHLSGQPVLMETLIEKKVNGREYIEAAKEETEEPFLFLPVDEQEF